MGKYLGSRFGIPQGSHDRNRVESGVMIPGFTGRTEVEWAPQRFPVLRQRKMDRNSEGDRKASQGDKAVSAQRGGGGAGEGYFHSPCAAFYTQRNRGTEDVCLLNERVKTSWACAVHDLDT